MSLTPHHTKYFAHDLTRRAASGMDRLSMALFDAAVDLNPHQIEAALFALQSPLSKGVILADEVGLGKTIEAGIVLCQFWAERKRRLLVICPASIRKQWALELEEKFNLPVLVLDAKAYREARRSGQAPLTAKTIVIMSLNYANSLREKLKAIPWDLVVIDEAHKLRNAYRPSSKVGQGIRWATDDCRKLLLTATPLQNSLLELYGLSTLIDERLFGDANSFRSQYATAGSNLDALRQRLAVVCKRTLRNQVTEYIRYTERRPITQPFKPTDDEHALYEAVSAFLQRENSYALPQRQRHLTALILRKLLASSSQAIAATLDTLRARLETLRDDQAHSDPEFAERLIEAEEIEDDLLDDILAEDEEADQPEASPVTIDRQKLRTVTQRLAGEAQRHAQATVSRSLEQNSTHFNEAREKLEKWADDMVLSAEKALQDTKEQIKALRRQARQAVTLAEQHEIQEKVQKLERQQRRQRQEIFKAEDEIMEKRDQLIDSLERRLAQRTETETLFTIRWAVE